MTRTAAAALLALLAACEGDTGTIAVSLTTAPGSTLLDGVQTLRMEVTNPRQVVMAERTRSGFELALELPATGTNAAILVDAFDAAGNLVANGASPRFPFGGISGRVVVYMAAPDSVDVAPLALPVARGELGTGVLPFGAILLGGRLASGGASDAVDIYNAFDHTLRSGMPLLAPRTAPAVAAGPSSVYIFGGLDDAGVATATLWRFDVGAPPAGVYLDVGDKSGFARAGEMFVPITTERFLLTGTPPAELNVIDASLSERSAVPSLPSMGVSVVANDGVTTSLFAGPDAIVRHRGGQFETLAVPGRVDGVLVAIAGGKAALVCGDTTDALRIDAATGTAETVPGVPSQARTGCAVAATSRHVLIAGGTTDAGVDGTVEVFDTATLAPVVTATLAVPRTGAIALPLPNDQILIAGGLDASGAPVATLELFTPLTAR